ncbi:hypothetical protein BDW74DRAFT_180336 [Aspergillus multicolor]|uniref:uncharacterized protein n=1 Tax=Aspergillus multicolor TaxID=41759 RepID=UPI003CCCAF49
MTKSMTGRLNLNWKPEDAFKLTKCHLVLCGTVTYYLKASWQEHSIEFVNSWGAIMHAAHLYNSVCHEVDLPRRWKDMEVLLSWHNEIFIRGRACRTDAILRRFKLSTGVSVAAYSRNRRQTGCVPEAKGGRRGLKPISNVLRMFFERHCEGSRKTGFSADELDKIIHDGVWEHDAQEDDSAEGGIPNMTRSGKNSAAQKRWTATQRLSPTETLQALRNTMDSELPELSFDYLLMHQMCWIALGTLRREVDSLLQRIFGVDYMEPEAQLPFDVGWILEVAAGRDEVMQATLEEGEDFETQIMEATGRTLCTMDGTGMGSSVINGLGRQGYRFEIEAEAPQAPETPCACGEGPWGGACCVIESGFG